MDDKREECGKHDINMDTDNTNIAIPAAAPKNNYHWDAAAIKRLQTLANKTENKINWTATKDGVPWMAGGNGDGTSWGWDSSNSSMLRTAKETRKTLQQKTAETDNDTSDPA